MTIGAPEALILDLLEWVALRERTYEETMDAWRTSCPRLPIWEDANDRGLLTTKQCNGRLLDALLHPALLCSNCGVRTNERVRRTLLGGWGAFLTRGPALLHRRLAIALLQGRERDGQDEFFLAVVVELDHNVFFGARQDRA